MSLESVTLVLEPESGWQPKVCPEKIVSEVCRGPQEAASEESKEGNWYWKGEEKGPCFTDGEVLTTLSSAVMRKPGKVPIELDDPAKEIFR